MADEFEVIIIGAGMAGTTCALLCARAGLSVLLVERGEQPGCKNLSGGRFYCYALGQILPDFHLHAPLERPIVRDNLSLLTPTGATTLSYQADTPSWTVLRARFDPWYAAQAQAAGVTCLFGVTVDALFKEKGRVAGVCCEGDVLRARTVVLAEGANSLLSEQSGLTEKPALHTMALGIKETLSLAPEQLEARFQLDEHDGAAWLFSGELCGKKPAGGFLYTHRSTLSIGVVAPLSSLRDGPTSASALLSRFKAHPTLRPLLRGAQTLEYGARLVPEGGLHSLPLQCAGEGWMLVGDALRTCINTGVTVRGMDMAILSGQAAAETLIATRQQANTPLHARYHRQLQHSLLWQQLERYQQHPALLQREGWYHAWPDLCHAVLADLSRAEAAVNPPLWRIVLHHARRLGLRRLSGDILRSLRCL